MGPAVDSVGNIYFADAYNNRVRVLTASAASCAYSVSPTTWQIPTAGGSQTFVIQTTGACSWTVSNLPSWLTVAGRSSGSGPGAFTLAAAVNTGPTLSAAIFVAGVSVAVTQAGGGPGCIYSVSPGGQAFAASGGNGTITVTAGAGCSWSTATTLSWISFAGATSGSGNGTVTFQAAPNTGVARSGSIAIAGLTFAVEQATGSLSEFTNAGSMAQLASAGTWSTTISLVNTSLTPV
jgi:hypothetical protein